MNFLKNRCQAFTCVGDPLITPWNFPSITCPFNDPLPEQVMEMLSGLLSMDFIEILICVTLLLKYRRSMKASAKDLAET